MIRHTLRVAALAAVSTAATAQVSVSLTSGGIGFGPDANPAPPFAIPAGTDILAMATSPGGLDLQQSSGFVGSANVRFIQSADELNVVMTGSGTGSFSFSTGGLIQVVMELSAPTPTDVSIAFQGLSPTSLFTPAFCNTVSFTAGFTDGATGTLTTLTPSTGCSQLPGAFDASSFCANRLDVTLGPTPSTLTLTTTLFASASGFGGPGSCPIGNTTFVVMNTSILPRSIATPYGIPCFSPQLRMSPPSFLSGTSEQLRISAPAPTLLNPSYTLALLLVGTSQAQTPLPPPFFCDLLVGNLVADVVLPVSPTNLVELSIPTPPAGLFTMQAVMTDGVRLSFTNGLQL